MRLIGKAIWQFVKEVVLVFTILFGALVAFVALCWVGAYGMDWVGDKLAGAVGAERWTAFWEGVGNAMPWVIGVFLAATIAGMCIYQIYQNYCILKNKEAKR